MDYHGLVITATEIAQRTKDCTFRALGERRVTWLNSEYVLQRRNDEAGAKLLEKLELDALVSRAAKATSKAKKAIEEAKKAEGTLAKRDVKKSGTFICCSKQFAINAKGVTFLRDQQDD